MCLHYCKSTQVIIPFKFELMCDFFFFTYKAHLVIDQT